MTVQSLKIGRREYVLLTKRDYQRMEQKARRLDEQEERDRGDVAESHRRMHEPGGRSLVAVRKRLGL
jgi:hypothetical protein